MTAGNSLRRLRKNKRAISPAVSTTILTAAIVAMLLITLAFVNSYLDGQIAQNDFNAMEQFMQTVGLQVDNVAWIPGRTQTLTYTSEYGQITFRYPALTYNFYLDGSLAASFNVGAILFDIPISDYSITNNYFEEIFPSSTSFLQNGSFAPVCRVFAAEIVPMPDGNYVRIVVAPIVRELNAVIGNVAYGQFYLPILYPGVFQTLSQSVTLTGLNVNQAISSNVSNVTVTIGFPNSTGMGLTSTFFNFAATSQTVILGSGSVVEIYGGNTTVSLGLST